jgi:hypothetical protein
MQNKEVVYFSVNNWFCGRDYPDTPNFRKWLGDDLNQNFISDEWCKENKLCVYYGLIDMSHNYTISAPRDWVEKNCPELLTDKEYTYETIGTYYDKNGKEITKRTQYTKKYSDFVYSQEDVDEGECDRVGDMPFREYCEENFGSEYYETGWWGDEDYDEDSDGDEEDDEYDEINAELDGQQATEE